ncbi:hypothetical protein WPS_27730 [Vulcanimicrobium alpinum]|uniref:Uncharacterized protein n=1 Tax=Vulcanimicrobium alpinum TaxID=3016050 RepID=A0AAN2CB96_UNVUL|nr:hypothetical protein WPS_27730 [Vulcanimicrobium alpinum]
MSYVASDAVPAGENAAVDGARAPADGMLAAEGTAPAPDPPEQPEAERAAASAAIEA